MPERNLTLILLANSDGLSAPFYDHWSVETSAFASTFLRLFVFEDGEGRTPPDPSWVAGQRPARSKGPEWILLAIPRLIASDLPSEIGAS